LSAGAILGGASIGAGVGVSSVALAPFNAANTFLGSAFFGYGMILGERYMYQEDWPKIQQRLVNGEKIENIIQEYTGVFTAVVMKEAKIVFDTVTREFISIMREALNPSGSILDPTTRFIPEGAPTIGDPRRTPAPQPSPAPTIPKFEKSIPSGPQPKEKIINVPKVTLPTTSNYTWLKANANGWVWQTTDPRKYNVNTKFGGKWNIIIRAESKHGAFKAANASWPNSIYANYQVNNRRDTFWVMRSKL